MWDIDLNFIQELWHYGVTEKANPSAPFAFYQWINDIFVIFKKKVRNKC